MPRVFGWSVIPIAPLVVLLGGCGHRQTLNVEIAPSSPPASTEKFGAAGQETPVQVERGHMSRRFGDVTVIADARPELHEELELLFEALGALDDEGFAFEAGATLPLGWTTITLQEQAEGLVVHEPDYDADNPEAAQRADISVSVEVLSRQRAVLALAQVEGESIDFDQHVLIVRGALEAEGVFMFRVASPGGRTTGWRIAPTVDAQGEMEVDSIPVYRLLKARPGLMAAMLLPSGYSAVFNGDELDSLLDGDDAVIWTRQTES